jgi:hypothetical protein
MAMQQVGVALGLPSALRTTEAELALLNQVTRQNFSKGCDQVFEDSATAAGLGTEIRRGYGQLPKSRRN